MSASQVNDISAETSVQSVASSSEGSFSGNWLVALAAAIGTLVDLNYEEQINTSIELITVMDAYFAKSEAYSELLTEDAADDYVAKLSINSEHPENACEAAAADAKYTSDSQAMNEELGELNSLISNSETKIKQTNDASSNLYAMMDPWTQLEKLVSVMITSFK